MRLSPRERRLKSDYRAIQELARESSIMTFESKGEVPTQYSVTFRGRGVAREANSGEIYYTDHHKILINLTSGYPRTMPELSWNTPIFHPNISAGGVVCLGGYGTHWVPSLRLDELCNMLWDMIRYKNYDVDSPYNREAAHWARSVVGLQPFPMDERPLRDLIADGIVDSDDFKIEPLDKNDGVQFIDPTHDQTDFQNQSLGNNQATNETESDVHSNRAIDDEDIVFID